LSIKNSLSGGAGAAGGRGAVGEALPDHDGILPLWTTRVLFPPNFGGNVTKFAQRKAQILIVFGQVDF